MKKAKILHNPTAGKAKHSRKELVSLVKAGGFDCGYSSTKSKGWKKLKDNVDFLIIAGGDGTVRRVAVKMLYGNGLEKNPPILLFPLGTANNIARSLGINGAVKDMVINLSPHRVKKYDVGEITGLKKKMIFLEAFGFGIFPELMKRIKSERTDLDEEAPPADQIKAAQELLHEIVETWPAETFRLQIDGQDIEGKFLLVEVMNISSLGPNLNLSPDADPGDGLFEVVLVSEEQRDELATYVSFKSSGIEKTFHPRIIRGRQIRIESRATLAHTDDELIEIKKSTDIHIEPAPAVMEFLVQ